MSGIDQQDTSPPVDEWLSLEQLAQELSVTAECIIGWIAEGRDIPHFQLGPGPGDSIFRRSEIAPLLRPGDEEIRRRHPVAAPAA